MSAHVLQCVWPIIDDSRTRNELIAEAKADLDKLADQAHANITGPGIWTVADAADVPGWSGYAPGMVLIANMPAEPYGSVRDHTKVDPKPDFAVVERLIAGNPPAKVRPTERTAAMAVMAHRGTGAEYEAVASRFGVTHDAVNQAVTRTRRRERQAAA